MARQLEEEKDVEEKLLGSDEEALLSDSFIQVHSTPKRAGTLFIEARIKDGLLQDPEFEVDEFVGFAEVRGYDTWVEVWNYR